MTAAELKASILDLAIRGKLVAQDPNDEPASEILKRIKAEKAKTATGKKTAALPAITDVDKPFEIPVGWEWVRLGEIATFINGDRGKNYPSKDKLSMNGYAPFISAINIRRRTVDQDGLLFLSKEQYCKLGSGKLEKNDIALCIRGSLGKFCIFPYEIGAIASSLVIMRPASELSLGYIAGYLESELFQYNIRLYDNGTAQPNLSAADVLKFVFPLPPLAEQKRIVEKVVELMPLVERYEKAEAKRVELEKALPGDLEKSILQEAIQGKLVEQDPNDEPASDLLSRIAAEKAKLIKEKKIKKEKPLDPIDESEVPFALPNGWAWCRLSEISECVGSRENQILAKEVMEQGSIPVVSQGQDLIDGYCDDVSKAIGDIPVVMFGDHTRNVKFIDFPFVIGADGTKFFKSRVDMRWLYYWTLYQSDQIRDRGYGRHWGLLNAQVVALPPLAEQKRIVAKVDELLGAIRRLH